mgnify:FL=1
MLMFGLKVHHSDLETLSGLNPDALEFVLHERDLGGEWADRVRFNGPMVLHAPEKHADGSLVDLGSGDESERLRAVDILSRTLQLADRMGAGMVVCHPGGVYDQPRDTGTGNLIRSMTELKTMSPPGVEPLMENMPDIYWNNGQLWHTSLFKDWKEIRAVLDTTGLMMCMDLCHAKLFCNSRHLDFLSYVTVLKPYIKHIHVSDALGTSGEGIQIGDGEIAFKDLKEVLFPRWRKGV